MPDMQLEIVELNTLQTNIEQIINTIRNLNALQEEYIALRGRAATKLIKSNLHANLKYTKRAISKNKNRARNLMSIYHRTLYAMAPPGNDLDAEMRIKCEYYRSWYTRLGKKWDITPRIKLPSLF